MSQVEFQSLFQTKAQRTRAIDDLQALRQQPGWRLVVQMLDALITDREKQILDNEEMSEAQRKDLKIQRKDFVFIRDLPEDTINELTSQNEQQEQTDDPY